MAAGGKYHGPKEVEESDDSDVVIEKAHASSGKGQVPPGPIAVADEVFKMDAFKLLQKLKS